MHPNQFELKPTKRSPPPPSHPAPSLATPDFTNEHQFYFLPSLGLGGIVGAKASDRFPTFEEEMVEVSFGLRHF